MSVNIKKHLSMLGLRVKDRVTGFTGTITCIGFDLYGCIQATVHPGIDAAGKMGDGLWLDIGRLETSSTEPVMEIPDFDYGLVAEGKKGPAEKPKFHKN